MVLGPARQTPLTASRPAGLTVAAGFPDGTANLFAGNGATGAALVDHPGIDKFAFSGSTAVGREIGARAGAAVPSGWRRNSAATALRRP